MQWGTYKRTCSFLFTAPPTPLILNFFREWPVPFCSPFASYQQSLRAKMERGNSNSQCSLLAFFLILFCCSCSLCDQNCADTEFLLLFLCNVKDTFCKTHISNHLPCAKIISYYFRSKEYQNTIRPEQRIVNVFFFNNDREEVGTVIITV